MIMRVLKFSHLCYVICVLCYVVGLFVATNPLYALTVDIVLATVDNEAITLSDYKRFFKENDNIENTDVVDDTLLKRLVGERLILREAIRMGIEASDIEVDRIIEEFKKQNALSQEDLEKMLAEKSMSIHSYRKVIKDRIILSKLISANVDSKIVVTDKEIEDFYIANKKDYLINPEEVEIKAIFLRLSEGASVTEITDLKRKVLRIVARLKDGDSFEKLANQYSDEPLKSQGGMLGEFKRGVLIPSLDNKAFSMRKDEISEPIWVSEGVYILQQTNKKGESFKTIEGVRNKIYYHLHEKKGEKLFNEWMKTLWEKASIIIKTTE